MSSAEPAGEKKGGQDDVLASFILRYGNDRVAFVEDVLGVDPEDWQRETLEAIDAGERRLSIRSAVGTGKTALAAWLVLHQLLTKYPQKTVATAPSAGQLFDGLLAECKLWLKKLPEWAQQLVNPKSERLELAFSPTESFASFRTADPSRPEVLQGIHAPYILCVLDEASGIAEPIFDAAQGVMTAANAIFLMISNPTRTTGTFYDSQTRLAHRWWTKKVTWEDSSQVSPDFYEEQFELYGDVDHPAFRARVLGEFPLQDENAFISRAKIESAVNRDIRVERGDIIWGLDVARTGADNSALAKRRGRVLLEKVTKWHYGDLMQTVGHVVKEYRDTPKPTRPAKIIVDVIGLGAGVADRLREIEELADCEIIDCNVAEVASTSERFVRLRDELWGKMREWLDSMDVSLPDDDELVNEMAAVGVILTSAGKEQAEPKDIVKKKLRRSPDKADAFALTFAYEGAQMSGRASKSWGQPIKRNYKGIV